MSDDAGRLASLDTSVVRSNSLRQFRPADAATDVDDDNDINGTAATSTLPSADNIHFLQLNLQHSKTASAVLQKQIVCCNPGSRTVDCQQLSQTTDHC